MPISLRFLVLGRTAPHRRFRTAVIVHGSRPGRLLRYKLCVAFRDGAASVQTPLAMLCDGIAMDPHSQDRGDQGDESDPRASTSQPGHIRLQRNKPHRPTGLTTSEISDRRNSAWVQAGPAVAIQAARGFQRWGCHRANAPCHALRRHRHRFPQSGPWRPG